MHLCCLLLLVNLVTVSPCMTVALHFTFVVCIIVVLHFTLLSATILLLAVRVETYEYCGLFCTSLCFPATILLLAVRVETYEYMFSHSMAQ